MAGPSAISVESAYSVDSYSRCCGKLAKWSHAANAIPRIFLVWRLPLRFVPLEKTGDECLLGERGQPHAASSPVGDHAVVVVARNNFDRRARLRRVVSDLVAVLRPDRFRTGQAHQCVAVGRRHVDALTEQFFHRKARILRSELGPSGE